MRTQIMSNIHPDPQSAAQLAPATAAPDTTQPAPISDEEFQAPRATARPYTAVILHPGPNRHTNIADAIIYQHGRRLAGLHRDGILPIVCPTTDSSDFSGLGIFTADAADVARIMNADPAVTAGVLTYELHAVRGFPRSTLPP
jgi:hypothetical protein